MINQKQEFKTGITHNGITFRIETVDINGVTKYQAFSSEDRTMSDIEVCPSTCIVTAISFINQDIARDAEEKGLTAQNEVSPVAYGDFIKVRNFNHKNSSYILGNVTSVSEDWDGLTYVYYTCRKKIVKNIVTGDIEQDIDMPKDKTMKAIQNGQDSIFGDITNFIEKVGTILPEGRK